MGKAFKKRLAKMWNYLFQLHSIDTTINYNNNIRHKRQEKYNNALTISNYNSNVNLPFINQQDSDYNFDVIFFCKNRQHIMSAIIIHNLKWRLIFAQLTNLK